MGRPGSGKDKQSELLASKLGGRIFSAGERVREIAKEDSELGRKVKEISEFGNLLPSWFASFILEEVLLSLKGDDVIIFNGVCRTDLQAKSFKEVCDWLGRDFVVIYLDVSEQTVLERLGKRRNIEGRVDDKSIQTRFDNYNEQTVPALNFFRSINKVIDINGEPLPDAVFAEVWQKVSAL